MRSGLTNSIKALQRTLNSTQLNTIDAITQKSVIETINAASSSLKETGYSFQSFDVENADFFESMMENDYVQQIDDILQADLQNSIKAFGERNVLDFAMTTQTEGDIMKRLWLSKRSQKDFALNLIRKFLENPKDGAEDIALNLIEFYSAYEADLNLGDDTVLLYYLNFHAKGSDRQIRELEIKIRQNVFKKLFEAAKQKEKIGLDSYLLLLSYYIKPNKSNLLTDPDSVLDQSIFEILDLVQISNDRKFKIENLLLHVSQKAGFFTETNPSLYQKIFSVYFSNFQSNYTDLKSLKILVTFLTQPYITLMIPTQGCSQILKLITKNISDLEVISYLIQKVFPKVNKGYQIYDDFEQNLSKPNISEPLFFDTLNTIDANRFDISEYLKANQLIYLSSISASYFTIIASEIVKCYPLNYEIMEVYLSNIQSVEHSLNSSLAMLREFESEEKFQESIISEMGRYGVEYSEDDFASNLAMDKIKSMGRVFIQNKIELFPFHKKLVQNFRYEENFKTVVLKFEAEKNDTRPEMRKFIGESYFESFKV